MTDMPLSPSRTAQLNAIEVSGWGRRLHIFQPRNFASWVFLLYLVLGAITTFRFFRPNAEAVTAATAAAFIAFAIYGLPWIWFFRHMDRWTQLPAKLVIDGFLWGGLTATYFIALPANGALLSIYNKVFSATFAQDWGPGLAAPFTEETGKGIGIMLLIFIAPRVIRTPFDGLILGAFVGLGFQLTENVLYAVNESLNSFGTNEISSVISRSSRSAASSASPPTRSSARSMAWGSST